MTKTILILSFFFFQTIAFAIDHGATQEEINDQKRKEELTHLIDKEIRMIEALKSYGPTIQFRLIELYAEKIKLVREKENKSLLHQDTNSAFKNKKYFFSNSAALYKKMKAMAKDLEKNTPRYPKLPQVFYIMGINSRDFDQSKETEIYLKKALSSAMIRAEDRHRANVALAEHYYNDKKYTKAIKHYRESIKDQNDQWLAKHWFNMAWCLFKIKNFQEAILALEKSYEISTDRRYLSVEEQVLDTVSIFHTNNGQVQRAIDFYLEKLKAPGDNLIKLAERAANKGDKAGAEKAINAALSSNELSDNDRIRYNLVALKIYRGFANEPRYITHSLAIETLGKKKEIGREEFADASDEIRSYTGFIQEKFFKQISSLSSESKDKTIAKIIRFFEIIILIAPTKASEMIYFQGETYFAAENFQVAANYYIKSIQQQKQSTSINLELMRKELDALLASLEKSSIEKNKLKSYLVYTYENYLQYFPQDQTTRAIYPKLNALYLSKKKIDAASKTLSRYIQYFPGDQKQQQNIVVSQIDFQIAQKNSYEMAKWVEKLKNGFLSFDASYIEKAQILLGNMLFQSIKKREKETTTTETIAKYIEIYKDTNYPDRIKEEAAYNIAVLYLQQFETKESVEWLLISNTHRSEDKTLAMENDLNSFLGQYYLRQDLASAKKLASYLLELTCRKKRGNKVQYFKQLSSLILAERTQQELRDLGQSIDKCQLRNNSEISDYLKKIIIQVYRDELVWPKKLARLYYISDEMLELKELTNTFWLYTSLGKSKVAKNAADQIRLLANSGQNEQAKKSATDFTLWNNWFNQLKTDEIFQWEEAKKASATIPFNQDSFNQQLEMLFGKLSAFEKEIDLFLKSDDSNIVLISTATLINTLHAFSSQLNLLQVKSGDRDFDMAFQKAMKNFSFKISKKENNLKNKTRQEIKRSRIISACAQSLSTDLALSPLCSSIKLFPSLIFDGIQAKEIK